MKRSVGFQFLVATVVVAVAFGWELVLAQVHSFPAYEISALAAFKRAAFEDPLSALADWNPLDGSPCNWTGVACSANRDCVVSLNLSGSSLKGFLTPELRYLGCLQELHLRNNLLLGAIPTEIGMLKNLTVLDLSVNRLTGPIPPTLGELTAVTKLDLHSNGLTGKIPPELGKLENLVELRLDRNRLEGQIPGGTMSNFSATLHAMHTSDNRSSGLCHSAKLRVGDFSYNFLIGQIPSCLKYLPRSSFQGNCFGDKYSVPQRTLQLCLSNKNQAITKETNKQSATGHKHQSPQQPEWLLILEATTGVLIVVCIITGIGTAIRTCKLKSSKKIHRKKAKSWKDDRRISIDGDILKNVLRFSRQELVIACEDFSNIIGTSSHSIVYKGTMKDLTEAAVISSCILEDQWTNYLQLSFDNKVADLARLDHENIAKLLGYCEESEPFSRMLVLDYASNGTLYEHLHYGDGSQLSWIRRMKIVLGVARGLRYLHTELQPPFVLSELSSNTVYLTEDFSPKLVELESWKNLFSKSKTNAGHIPSGGFLPGYNFSLEQLEMEVQGNIFAFGVLLLEIISGRPPYCKERGCLINWATAYLQNPEDIGKLADPELKNMKSEDLAVICSVVSLCIEPDPTKRPSMQIISGVLENGIDLSAAALLKESPLAWAELALSS
ncbi:putative LRR receptor-like serine/threonine-protein kinase At1g63430 isoform X2 [Curcuma longa]|uniref:putative LRR receptor-like serine/threonine-protein kinase At1g63430 isoform X2 n=1 Tax=Curcuma longa TaxID=136217 RepID=UPI003D9F8CDA